MLFLVESVKSMATWIEKHRYNLIDAIQLFTSMVESHKLIIGTPSYADANGFRYTTHLNRDVYTRLVHVLDYMDARFYGPVSYLVYNVSD